MGHNISRGAYYSCHPAEVPRGVVACFFTGHDYHEALAFDGLEFSKHYIRRLWVDNRDHSSYGQPRPAQAFLLNRRTISYQFQKM